MRPWIVALALLVLVGGVVAAVALLRSDDAGGDSGDYPVEVVGQRGVVFRGTVAVEDATALRALLAAGSQGGFSVQVQGQGETAFVVAVAGQRNQGASGWCFEVLREGAWLRPPVSSARFDLRDGDAVRWYWGAGGCRE